MLKHTPIVTCKKKMHRLLVLPGSLATFSITFAALICDADEPSSPLCECYTRTSAITFEHNSPFVFFFGIGVPTLHN